MRSTTSPSTSRAPVAASAAAFGPARAGARCVYESFILPLTILSGLPSAGVGALLTLLLFGMELNIYGFVGIIMLVGIVKKNAIMMTTMAALFDTLPIALG